MGWLLIILMAAALLGALWRFGGFDRLALQLVASALLLAMAGYAWQGRPGLAGKPVPPPGSQRLGNSAFSEMRGDLLGRFDTGARWLTIADSYHRSGKTVEAVGVIRAGIRAHPDDPELWTGLANALMIHGGGRLSPAAEFAFNRAIRLSPRHPGPRFFYGLALAQSGDLDRTERIWRGILVTAPQDAPWRPMVEEKLFLLGELRAARQASASR